MIFRSRFSGTGQSGCHEYGTSSRDTFEICAENSGGSAGADGVDGLGDEPVGGLGNGLDDDGFEIEPDDKF